MKKISTIAVYSFLILVLAFGLVALPAKAADHLDAPFVDTDGRIDITDVYAFTHGSNTVLIMNVNPLAGVLSPNTFRPDALYQFRIDNTGDAREDITYGITFSKPDQTGAQAIKLRRTGGGKDDEGEMEDGAVIARGKTGANIQVKGGGMLRVGLFDDPFFFDLNAFKKFSTDGNTADFCAPGSNFFAGLNVTSIVLEVPTASLLGSSAPVIYPWATVSLRKNEHWMQVERMGKPALATVFIKPTGGANSDSYNTTAPADDLARWGSFFPANPIPVLGGIPVRNLLLPDTLILNTSGPLVLNNIPFGGYPNGRGLADDVIDTSFFVLSNAGVLPSNLTSDCVSNDSNFSTSFPYLAPAN